MRRLYEVEILRDTRAQKAEITREFYVANSMTQVIDNLKVELNDANCEVIKIHGVVPILAVLNEEAPKNPA